MKYVKKKHAPSFANRKIPFREYLRRVKVECNLWGVPYLYDHLADYEEVLKEDWLDRVPPHLYAKNEFIRASKERWST